jgi:mannose-6-phosphate isomerase-like protein (cupin superfamily)
MRPVYQREVNHEEQGIMLVLLFLMPGVDGPTARRLSGPTGLGKIADFERSARVSWQRGLDDPGGISAGWRGTHHRHKAHAFVYVLEGSIIMQVKSGNEVTLTPGAQTPATRAAIAQANDGLRKAFFKRGKSGS